MTDEFPPLPQAKTTAPPDQARLAAARAIGSRPVPQPEPGRIAAVVGRRYAPLLVALTFAGALVLFSPD